MAGNPPDRSTCTTSGVDGAMTSSSPADAGACSRGAGSSAPMVTVRTQAASTIGNSMTTWARARCIGYSAPVDSPRSTSPAPSAPVSAPSPATRPSPSSRPPPSSSIVQLARALHVSTDELFGLKPVRPANGHDDPGTRRLWKKFQQVAALPEKDRRAVIRLVNSLVQSKSRSAQTGPTR